MAVCRSVCLHKTCRMTCKPLAGHLSLQATQIPHTAKLLCTNEAGYCNKQAGVQTQKSVAYQVHQNTTGHVSASRGLVEVHVHSFQLQITAALISALKVDAMLSADHLLQSPSKTVRVIIGACESRPASLKQATRQVPRAHCDLSSHIPRTDHRSERLRTSTYPELTTNLIAALTPLYMHDFPHGAGQATPDGSAGLRHLHFTAMTCQHNCVTLGTVRAWFSRQARCKH